jgi:hypothetical protein
MRRGILQLASLCLQCVIRSSTVRASPGFINDTSHYRFAPLRIGYSEDRHLANRWMLINDRLDLTGVDIFAARDNHVLQAM